MQIMVTGFVRYALLDVAVLHAPYHSTAASWDRCSKIAPNEAWISTLLVQTCCVSSMAADAVIRQTC